MNDRTSSHTDFVIERVFEAPPETVFMAWADPAAKRQWSDCHAEYTTAFSLDFRPQGTEVHRVAYPDGRVQESCKVFFDIVEGRRIVFAYDLCVDGRRLSVSLVTVDFDPDRRDTRMRYSEQVAYLDGHEDREARRHGTKEGLDRLGLYLEAPASAH